MDLAREKKYAVIDLRDNRANRKEVSGVLKKFQSQHILVLFNGHGNKSTICGQHGEALIEAGVDDKLLSGNIIFTLSCETAELLGPASIANGAQAYIGYTKPFWLYRDLSMERKPLQDELAELYLKPTNEVSCSLIKGHTVGEAYNKSKQSQLKNIQKVATSESELGYTLPSLLSNYMSQVCLGNTSATTS